MCLACKKTLHSHELVPLFSYAFLGGRCKGCKTKISIQYPIIELITGLIFAGLFYKFANIFYFDPVSFAVTFGYYAVVFSLLLVIAVHDFKHKIIPDSLAIFLGTLAIVGLFLFEGNMFYPHFPDMWDYLRGILFALPFAALWFFSKGTWMGLGDAKIAISIGWIFGVTVGISAIILAFWIGALVGVVLLLLKKVRGVKSEMPLAPFIALGALIAFLFEINVLPLGF